MTENNMIKLDQRLADLIESGGKPSSAYGRGMDSRGSRPDELYATQDSRRITSGLKPLSNASERSRSSAIKDVGSQILSPGANITSPAKDGDYWTKIIMHNVE
jgi:hypothetical protein